MLQLSISPIYEIRKDFVCSEQDKFFVMSVFVQELPEFFNRRYCTVLCLCCFDIHSNTVCKLVAVFRRSGRLSLSLSALAVRCKVHRCITQGTGGITCLCETNVIECFLVGHAIPYILNSLSLSLFSAFLSLSALCMYTNTCPLVRGLL